MAESKPKEVRTILQIMPAPLGWTVAYADDLGGVMEWPLAAWALVESRIISGDGADRVLEVGREVTPLVDNEFGFLEEATESFSCLGVIPAEPVARSARLGQFKSDAKVLHQVEQERLKKFEAEAAAARATSSKKPEGIQ